MRTRESSIRVLTCDIETRSKKSEKISNIFSSALHFDTIKHQIKKCHVRIPIFLSILSINGIDMCYIKINPDKTIFGDEFKEIT